MAAGFFALGGVWESESSSDICTSETSSSLSTLAFFFGAALALVAVRVVCFFAAGLAAAFLGAAFALGFYIADEC